MRVELAPLREDDLYLIMTGPPDAVVREYQALLKMDGRYRPVLELLRRTFGDDLVACQRCGGRMRLVALVKDQQSIDRFLRGIGQSDFPPIAPARGPPYSRASRDE